jgi:hypothetical protein
MSALTRCNYCTHQSILSRARQEDQSVTIRAKPLKGFPQGVDILLDGKWVAWFAELPTQCRC